MRLVPLLLFSFLLAVPSLAADQPAAEQTQPVELEFGGYKFGQSPAANMVCFSGYCKSQAPGGDGQINFPFSIYETPGAVSTQIGMLVVNPRYNFWEDALYRVFFQVDCTPQPTEECIDDLTESLNREYGLTPLFMYDHQNFVVGSHSIQRAFVTETGALVRIRAGSNKNGWQMPTIDIIDKRVADHIGSSLNPTYRSKFTSIPDRMENP
jgi:hypothetical protein